MPCCSALEREGGRERPRGRGPPRTFPGIFCLMCQPISSMKMDGGVVVVASASARPFSPPSRTFVDCSCGPFRPSFLRPAGRADDDDDNDGQPLGPCHSSVNSIGNCARCGELGAVIPDFGRKTCCLPKRTVTEGTSTISIEEKGVCQLILIFNFYYHYYYCFLNFFYSKVVIISTVQEATCRHDPVVCSHDSQPDGIDSVCGTEKGICSLPRIDGCDPSFSVLPKEPRGQPALPCIVFVFLFFCCWKQLLASIGILEEQIPLPTTLKFVTYSTRSAGG
ncbi:hypothetical protein LZ32DRAFT_310213 [Colletotrichum eremochloae]|nr:hypothetical protein LZ32DRAFT_310213 [Colletotrichum eremochloae]